MDQWNHPSELQVPDAFEVFYREMYAPVVAIVYGLTRSRWVAEDIAQEAFLRAYRDWSRVVRMESPSGWVRRVAVNLARSRFRRLRAEVLALARLGPSRHQLAPPEPEVEAFWAEVRRLPTRQAQAIALRYITDLQISEIAEVMEVAEGTVKALLHQGRRRLEPRLRVKGLLDEQI